MFFVVGYSQSKRFMRRIRMKQKSQPRSSDEAIYRIVEITGFVVRLNKEDLPVFDSQLKHELQRQQQSYHCHRSEAYSMYANGSYHSKIYPNLVFKAFVKVVPNLPTNDLTLADANCDEYVTRLSLDGTLIYSDHRISMITGFSPSEVFGRSAYEYILTDDQNISLFAHRLSKPSNDFLLHLPSQHP